MSNGGSVQTGSANPALLANYMFVANRTGHGSVFRMKQHEPTAADADTFARVSETG